MRHAVRRPPCGRSRRGAPRGTRCRRHRAISDTLTDAHPYRRAMTTAATSAASAPAHTPRISSANAMSRPTNMENMRPVHPLLARERLHRDHGDQADDGVRHRPAQEPVGEPGGEAVRSAFQRAAALAVLGGDIPQARDQSDEREQAERDHDRCLVVGRVRLAEHPERGQGCDHQEQAARTGRPIRGADSGTSAAPAVRAAAGEVAARGRGARRGRRRRRETGTAVLLLCDCWRSLRCGPDVEAFCRTTAALTRCTPSVPRPSPEDQWASSVRTRPSGDRISPVPARSTITCDVRASRLPCRAAGAEGPGLPWPARRCCRSPPARGRPQPGLPSSPGSRWGSASGCSPAPASWAWWWGWAWVSALPPGSTGPAHRCSASGSTAPSVMVR